MEARFRADDRSMPGVLRGRVRQGKRERLGACGGACGRGRAVHGSYTRGCDPWFGAPSLAVTIRRRPRNASCASAGSWRGVSASVPSGWHSKIHVAYVRLVWAVYFNSPSRLRTKRARSSSVKGSGPLVRPPARRTFFSSWRMKSCMSMVALS